MNFKEQLKKDLDNVFFNTNEFAEETIVDGSVISVVPDDHELEKYNLKADGEGLARGELLFHVPVSAFTEKPFIGKRMRVSGKLYEILSRTESMGVYSIVLVGHES